MAEFEALPLVVGLGGIVLVYSAVKNRNPADVVKLALQGKDISKARAISGAGAAPPGPGAVDGRTLPGTPGADGDARTDPPGFDPERDDVLPILPGESTPMTPPISWGLPIIRNPYYGNGTV